MIRKKAFTLTELLIALSIVGAIAALSIPAVIEDINRRLLVNQLKNTLVTVQQIMDEELINKNTKDLSQTDFSKPATLYSHFAIVGTCDPTKNPCWGPAIENNISYKTLKELKPARAYPTYNTGGIKLKNGVSLLYHLTPDVYESDQTINDGTKDGDKCYGLFYIDVNGKDKPNITGRDLFAFRVTKKGKISYGMSCSGTNNHSDATLLNYCKDGGTITACTALLQRYNWKMKY